MKKLCRLDNIHTTSFTHFEKHQTLQLSGSASESLTISLSGSTTKLGAPREKQNVTINVGILKNCAINIFKDQGKQQYIK